MTDEDLLFWYGLLEQILYARSANAAHTSALATDANPGSRTLPAHPDEGKSEDRRDFDNMIFRIADRIAGQPPAPIPPLVLSHAVPPHAEHTEAAPADDDANAASELLKVLRRKLGV
jgi:hypothetical protein